MSSKSSCHHSKQRGTDILLIGQYYIQQFFRRMRKPVTGIDSSAAERLLNYAWPGNVRELRNVMERAVALTRSDKIEVADLPKKIQEFRDSQAMFGRRRCQRTGTAGRN